MRIAWFSPLTAVVRSRAAYASSLLLDVFQKDLSPEGITIDLFADLSAEGLNLNGVNAVWRSPAGKHWRVYDYLAAAARHQRQPYDLFFYQIEDGPQALFCRHMMATHPGVAWFHEVLFTTPLAPAIALSPWCSTLRMLNGYQDFWESRDWHVQVEDAPEINQERFRGLYQDPFGWREASFALVPVFSQAWQHREFRRLRGIARDTMLSEYGDTGSGDYELLRGALVPLPIPSALASGVHRAVYKGGEDHAVGQGFITHGEEVRVAWAGTPSIESRAFKVLAAAVVAQVKLVWLVAEDEVVRARELIAEASAEARVELVTGRSPARWQELVASARVSIHLHYSVYGSLEPYLSISLAQGVPALVSDFGEGGALSDAVVLKIAPGRGETAAIAAGISALGCTTNLGAWRHALEMSGGVRGRVHPERIAGELFVVFERARNFIRGWSPRSKNLYLSAEQEVHAVMNAQQGAATQIFKDAAGDINDDNARTIVQEWSQAIAGVSDL